MKQNEEHNKETTELNQEEVVAEEIIAQRTPYTAAGSADSGESGEDEPFKQNPYLPEKLQKNAEKALGEDFSNVNVYKNSSKATELGAKAFAQGNEIHFAPGRFNPYSDEGKELIAHELVHIAQQSKWKLNQQNSDYNLAENQAENFKNNVSLGHNISPSKITTYKFGEIQKTPEDEPEIIKLGSINDRVYFRRGKSKVKRGYHKGQVVLENAPLYEYVDASEKDPSAEPGVHTYIKAVGRNARLDAEFTILEELYDIDNFGNTWLKISFEKDLSRVFFIQFKYTIFTNEYYKGFIDVWGNFTHLRAASDSVKLGKEFYKLGWPWGNDAEAIRQIKEILKPYNYHGPEFKVLHDYFMINNRKKFEGKSIPELIIQKIPYYDELQIFHELSALNEYRHRDLVRKRDNFQKTFNREEREAIKWFLISTTKRGHEFGTLRDKIKAKQQYEELKKKLHIPGMEQPNYPKEEKSNSFELPNPYVWFTLLADKDRNAKIKLAKKTGYNSDLVDQVVADILKDGWKLIAKEEQERQILETMKIRSRRTLYYTTDLYDQVKKEVDEINLRRAMRLLTDNQRKIYKFIQEAEKIKKEYSNVPLPQIPFHVLRRYGEIISEMKALGKLPDLYDVHGNLPSTASTRKKYAQRIQNKSLDLKLQKTYKERLGEVFYQKCFQYSFTLSNWENAKKSVRTAKNVYYHQGQKKIMSTQQSNYAWRPVEEAKEQANYWENIFWDKKAELIAVMRAYLLNENLGAMERDGFLSSFNEGFWESIGYHKLTKKDLINGYAKALGAYNLQLTESQRKRLERTVLEDVGSGLGATISTTVEIAITAFITKGAGATRIASKIGKATYRTFRKFMGAKKAKIVHGMWIASLEGAISYKLANQSAVAGAMENTISSLIDIKIAKKYPFIVRFILKSLAETTGEYIGEKAGTFASQLWETGGLIESLEKTFGANLSQMQHQFIVDVLTSFIMNKGIETGKWTYDRYHGLINQVHKHFSNPGSAQAKKRLLEEIYEHQKKTGVQLNIDPKKLETQNNPEEVIQKAMPNYKPEEINDKDADWVAMMDQGTIKINLENYNPITGDQPIKEELSHLWIDILHASLEYEHKIDYALKELDGTADFDLFLKESKNYVEKAKSICWNKNELRNYLLKEYLGQLVTGKRTLKKSSGALVSMIETIKGWLENLLKQLGINSNKQNYTIKQIITDLQKDIHGEKVLTNATNETIEKFLLGKIAELNVLRAFGGNKPITLHRNKKELSHPYYNLDKEDKIIKDKKAHGSNGFFLDEQEYKGVFTKEELMSPNHEFISPKAKNEAGKWKTRYAGLRNCTDVVIAAEHYFESIRNNEKEEVYAANTGDEKPTHFITSQYGFKKREQYFSEYMSASEIIEIMMKLPEGASGIVAGNLFVPGSLNEWQGHVFSVVKRNNKVWFVDFQIGEIYRHNTLSYRAKLKPNADYSENEEPKSLRLFIPNFDDRKAAGLGKGYETHRVKNNTKRTELQSREIQNKILKDQVIESTEYEQVKQTITDEIYEGDFFYQNRDLEYNDFMQKYEMLNRKIRDNEINKGYQENFIGRSKEEKERFLLLNKVSFEEQIVRLAMIPKSDRQVVLQLLSNLIHGLKTDKYTATLMNDYFVRFNLLDTVKHIEGATFKKLIETLDYLQKNDPVSKEFGEINRHRIYDMLVLISQGVSGIDLLQQAEIYALEINPNFKTSSKSQPTIKKGKVIQPSKGINYEQRAKNKEKEKVYRNLERVRKSAPNIKVITGKNLQKPDDAQFSFIGEKGLKQGLKSKEPETWKERNEQLVKAKKLLSQNVPMKEIWEATGWFMGKKDQKWRYEIDITSSSLTQGFNIDELYKQLNDDSNLTDSVSSKLKKILHVDELYELYFGLEDARVEIYSDLESNSLAEFVPDKKFPFIRLNIGRVYQQLKNKEITVEQARNQVKASLFHETQHYIQQIEEFTPGTSVKMEEKTLRDKIKNAYPEQYAKWKAAYESFSEYIHPDFLPSDYIVELSRELYKSSIGEIEAKNVEKNINSNNKKLPKVANAEGPNYEKAVEDWLEAYSQWQNGLDDGQNQFNNGKWLGAFTKEGEVIINLTDAQPDTPIHEFGHFWMDILDYHSPLVLDHFLNILKNENLLSVEDSAFKKEWDKINKNPQYANMPERMKVKELFAVMIGKYGANLMDDGPVKTILRKIWNAILQLLRIRGLSRIANQMETGKMSMKEFASYWAREITDGKVKTNLSSVDVQNLLAGKELKDMQFYGTVLKELNKHIKHGKTNGNVEIKKTPNHNQSRNQYQFAGEKSLKNLEKDNSLSIKYPRAVEMRNEYLEKYEEWIKNGRKEDEKPQSPARAIYLETGWIMDNYYDEKQSEIEKFGLRYEFSSKEAELKESPEWLVLEKYILEQGKKLNQSVQNTKAKFKLTDLLEYKELYQRYPDLSSNIKVSFVSLGNKNLRGRFIKNSNEVIINLDFLVVHTARIIESKKTIIGKERSIELAKRQIKFYIRTTLIHEIQHRIQQHENLKDGSNASYWKNLLILKMLQLKQAGEKKEIVEEFENIVGIDLVQYIELKESGVDLMQNDALDAYIQGWALKNYKSDVGEQGAFASEKRIDKTEKELKKDPFFFEPTNDGVTEFQDFYLYLQQRRAARLYENGKNSLTLMAFDGEILLDRKHITPNTKIHRFAHIWLELVDRIKPGFIETISEQIMRTDRFKILRESPNYKTLSDQTLMKEVLAFEIGHRGIELKKQGIIKKIFRAISKIISRINGQSSQEIEAAILEGTYTLANVIEISAKEITKKKQLSKSARTELIDFLSGKTDKIELDHSILKELGSKGGSPVTFNSVKKTK